jgi:putative tricarboxylic transport membrane protein
MLVEVGSSLAPLISPLFLLVMFLGVFAGLVVSVIPGLTSTMAVALLVPMTYGMDVGLAITLLVAVYIGGMTGGFVTAALLKIPGGPASVATTFDAYPMAQRGEAGKVLSLGIIASFFGGMMSFFALVAIAPALGKFALRFSSFEYFALVVFALTCVVSLSRDSLLKGCIAACLGLVLSTVGLSEVDGASRFVIFPELRTGFNVLPVLIGVYATSQILIEIGKMGKPFTPIHAAFNLREFFVVLAGIKNSIGNLLRSSLIGIGIGLLPGIGPALSNIVAYSQAKNASKDPDSFGKGNPEGIIAPESANNACVGGSMIPMLTLGIPGDATTMMMLGAFMIHGIQPGPLLFSEHTSLVALIFGGYFISNIFMLLIMMLFIRVMIKALTMPLHIIYPVILAMCIIGTFAVANNLFDSWVFLIMGVFGFLMTIFKFPLLPLVLGLILGSMAERELRISLVHGGGSLVGFLDRPIALFFLALAFLSVCWSLYKMYKEKKATAVSPEGSQ